MTLKAFTKTHLVARTHILRQKAAVYERRHSVIPISILGENFEGYATAAYTKRKIRAYIVVTLLVHAWNANTSVGGLASVRVGPSHRLQRRIRSLLHEDLNKKQQRSAQRDGFDACGGAHRSRSRIATDRFRCCRSRRPVTLAVSEKKRRLARTQSTTDNRNGSRESSVTSPPVAQQWRA